MRTSKAVHKTDDAANDNLPVVKRNQRKRIAGIPRAYVATTRIA